MTEQSVLHASFTIERTYPTTPQRVFAAWSDPALKTRWFGGGDEQVSEYQLDFQVGGREFSRGVTPNDQPFSYDAVYQDIIPNQRIVYTYYMHIGGPRISVSLSTVQFFVEGTGTRMVYTEQGAYLDGLDTPQQREDGTRELLDALGRVLDSERARTS